MKAAARLLVLPILFAGSVRGGPVAFDFSSLGSSQIVFDGTSGSVAFLPDSGGFDFRISDSNLPGLAGLQGGIGGTFAIGPVTSFGFFQDAPVNGTGIFSISDGSALFTATVSWVDAEMFGSTGALNSYAVANLSDFSYGGSNLALQALAGSSGGVVTASFQFAPMESLDELASGGSPQSTSYSGSAVISVSESANTALLLGFALFGLAVARFRGGSCAVGIL
jgi:hypothetical protein